MCKRLGEENETKEQIINSSKSKDIWGQVSLFCLLVSGSSQWVFPHVCQDLLFQRMA